MFKLFGRKKSVTAKSLDKTALYFKSGADALEYCCKYMDNPVAPGAHLIAVVEDARFVFDAPAATSVQKDGIQVVALRVASDNNDFHVMATTVGPKGPTLVPGQLVLWRAGQFSEEMARLLKDSRFGWVGHVIGTLKPEYRNGGWVGDQRFSA